MTYYIVRTILFLLSFLPLPILRGLGSILGSLVAKISPKSLKRIKKNLLVTGFATEDNVDKLAIQNLQETLKTIIESFVVVWQSFKYRRLARFVNFINAKPMFDDIYNGTPILYMTPHLANFEITVQSVAQMVEREFTILYKPSKDKLFTRLMESGRTRRNVIPVPTTKKGVITFAKTLRDGGMVGLLPDSIASQGDGEWIKFFNQDMFAPTLAAKMVTMKNVVTYMTVCTRTKKGFDIEFVRFEPKNGGTTAEILQQIYDMIEFYVSKNPSQYFWSYDRFRRPDHAHEIN